MKSVRVSVCAVLVSGLAVVSAPTVATASSLFTVNPGQSIQAAIDAASPGDTIKVMPGDYIGDDAGAGRDHDQQASQVDRLEQSQGTRPSRSASCRTQRSRRRSMASSSSPQIPVIRISMASSSKASPWRASRTWASTCKHVHELHHPGQRVDQQPGERNLPDALGQRAGEEKRRLRLARQRAVGRGFPECPCHQERARHTARRASRVTISREVTMEQQRHPRQHHRSRPLPSCDGGTAAGPSGRTSVRQLAHHRQPRARQQCAKHRV